MLKVLSLSLLSFFMSLSLFSEEIEQPYLHFPYLYSPPLDIHSDADRMFQGIPSIAVTHEGRLWATWYGGGDGEGHENYIMIATSGDGGVTWTDVLTVIDPPFRASEPAVWVDPQGRLWWMANLYPGVRHLRTPGSQLWVLVAEDPESESPVWSEPRLIAKELNNFNKPTVLSTGRWIWPTGTWVLRNLSRPIYSDNEGKSFHALGEIPMDRNDRNFEEYQVVEREDGSLWLLTRTSYGIGESFSHDHGATWSKVTPSSIKMAVTRFYISRLQSGRLLLVKNGPIDEDIGRSQMMAFLSDDDGESWYGGLMLDERDRVSYPDGDQGKDGTIYVTYDRGRHADDQKEILLAVFTEEDVKAGQPVSERVMLKQVINQAHGLNPRIRRTAPVEVETVELLLGDSPLVKLSTGQIASVESGATLFTDRDYVLKEIPEALRDKNFARMSLQRGGRVTAVTPGILYVATPRPEVNRDNVQHQLLEQGFTLSDIEPFLIFNHPAARSSVFQKLVEPGEGITIGKWGVVFF